MTLVSQSTKTYFEQKTRPVFVVEDAKGLRIINLDHNIYSIGRDSKNSIIIYSKLVSRHHATLLRVTNPVNGSCLFQIVDGDLQGNRSTNGLIINSKHCLSKTLQSADLVVFGGNAQARYFVIDSSLSDREIFQYYEAGNLVDDSTISIDPCETVVLSEVNIEKLTETALIRLASFPELIPIPIIEIDLFGQITYMNPSAILQLADLQEAKLKHSVIAGLIDAVQDERKQFFVREVEVGSLVFEQSVHYIAETRLIRSYLIDITHRKEAEKELKRVNESLEIKVEKRTLELRESIEQLKAEIAERQQAEATIRYQASHDLLTGLSNRTLFNQQLRKSLAQASKSGQMLAVMFLDLDRFKTINDTLGHAVGDRLLQSFAQRLTGCLRSGDPVARWGGDEFTVLLPQIITPEDAAKIAQRILDAMTPAFNLESPCTGGVIPPLHISSSIGIALYPHDGEDAETLLRQADTALYRAKENGRNNYRFYMPEMNSQGSALLTLENRLHRALERGEFTVYYQPQVDITTMAIAGMEALLRWQHPEQGLIPPAQFIPLAEQTGLIVPIGEWVLRTACAQNKVWQDAGFSELRMGVNLSPRQFQEPNLVELVAHVLSETGLAPEYLELEITETTVMQNLDFATSMLDDLQEMGVHISMDDFGTGYSSLGYLKKFPFHTLKIDRSFIGDLTDNPQDKAIISAVLALARGLNLRVVAEGVETYEQKELLRSLECEQMQGYLFSRPLKAEDATKLLHQYAFKI